MLARARCTNHDSRQAAGLCPSCRRPFCRECLTEHEGRLTCAACLRRTAKASLTGPSLFAQARRALVVPALALAALFGSWIFFYSLGITFEMATAPPVERPAR